MKIKLLYIGFLLLQTFFASAQSLEHPIIFGTIEDRARILDLIENHSWAKSIVEQLHQQVDSKLEIHQTDPNAILNSTPEFVDDDSHTEAEASSRSKGHYDVLSTASNAGLLYYLTREEKYSQFAADIFAFYMEEIANRTPETTTIGGNSFYDPRASYIHFALTYDFIYNFIKKTNAKVYDRSSNSLIDFDNSKAQKALKNVIGNVLQEYGGKDNKYGERVSNHPILTATGALFPILCIEDDTERERLFKVFWETGTKHQNSFTKTILPLFGEQGVWPEALSYSFMPAISMVLNIVDRVKPELNVIDENLAILKGNFLFDNLRNPDRRFVRYGDSHRDNDGTGKLYRFTLNIAERRGYKELELQAKIALRQAYDATGGFNPKISTSQFNNTTAVENLFWNIPIPEALPGEIDFQKPTVIVEHAGVALQRNYVEEKNEEYGLCGIIGGAHYVHSHVTGIAMELYGTGYVMAANGGLPNSLAGRKEAVHREYFWRHAGNNTMVVNGTTHGIQDNAWNRNSYLWQNTTVNIAAEPKHLENPISKSFSFATQFLEDEVNNCRQERTLSTIRTSKTTAYYFDLFRSKSLNENNFHDYIYHNLGDEVAIANQAGEILKTTSTDRYQSDIGDPVKSPGWRFFEETKVTRPTSMAINIRFHLKYDNRFMHMFIPGGIEREYTEAVGPATREAKNGYEDKKTQIIAIRQKGEAWDRPYIAIFEPSSKAQPAVITTKNISHEGKLVGAEVVSKVNGAIITDVILCNDADNMSYALKDYNISFKGRFAIIRTEVKDGKTNVSLYIGDGQQLTFEDQELKTNVLGKGIKEFTLDYEHEYTVITDLEDTLEEKPIMVFPNPSQSGLFKLSRTTKYKIYNLKGKLIAENKGSSIDLSSCPKGVYWLHIDSNVIKLVR